MKYEKPNARDLNSLSTAEGACSSGFAVGPCTGGGSAGSTCTNGYTAGNTGVSCSSGTFPNGFIETCGATGMAAITCSTGVTAA